MDNITIRPFCACSVNIMQLLISFFYLTDYAQYILRLVSNDTQFIAKLIPVFANAQRPHLASSIHTSIPKREEK